MASAATPGPAAPRQRGLRQAVAALHHRDFARFWFGALVSNIGTWMQNATVPYVLYRLTGSGALVGIAAFCQLFPTMLLGPVGGALADRHTRRSVLLSSQSAQLVVATAVWLLWISGLASAGALIGLLAVSGVIAGLSIPSWQAFVGELVPRSSLLNAVTLNSAQFNAARALGPVLAGAAIAGAGPGLAFAVNALSYVAVLGALASVRTHRRTVRAERARGGFLESFREGAGYARRHAGVAVSLVLVVATAGLGGPVVQLAPIFAEDVYRVGPTAYGLLTGALGAGAVIGAAIVGSLGDVARGRLVQIALFVYAASIVGFGLSRSFPVGVAMLLLGGGGYLAVVSALNTSIQVLVPDEVKGRVLALYVMAFTGSFPVGALVQGWLADRIGAPATVVGAGVLLLAVWVAVAVKRELLVSLDHHVHRRRWAHAAAGPGAGGPAGG